MIPACAGEGVDPTVMQEVAKMVAQSCSTCSKAMRAEGVKVKHCLIAGCTLAVLICVLSLVVYTCCMLSSATSWCTLLGTCQCDSAVQPDLQSAV